MSLAMFHAKLSAQLLADAGLKGWANEHFGKALTQIDGNVPVSRINANEYPALVIEIGDGLAEAPRGDDDRQETETELLLSVIWQEHDPEAAFAQRLDLPNLLQHAVLEDVTLAGAVDQAWLADWESDRNLIHPKHMMRATVRAQFLTERG